MASHKNTPELIVSAARQAVDSLSGPSAVSRPPFQCFADQNSAQYYFAKQIVDLLTPHLLLVANSETNDYSAAWRAQARLSQYLLGAQFADRFGSSDSDKSRPDYRAVQQLVGEVVHQLAEDGAEVKLLGCLGKDEGKVEGVIGIDSVDAPVARQGCARLVSHASVKNRGRRNEDRLLVAAYSNKDLGGDDDNEASFLGVLDGHGGSDGADLAASYLLPLFLSSSKSVLEKGEDSSTEPTVARRLCRSFVDADARLGEAASQCGAAGGCTCTVCIISGDQLTVAWAGDSEAWLVHSNLQATQLTAPPHRPSVPTERTRVESAGGFVMDGSPPRLNGVLAVTRSLGDRGVVGSTPEPEIVQRQLHTVNNDEGCRDVCIVLASDGLWDAVDPNDAAAALVAMQLDSSSSTEKEASAAKALIDMAVSAGSTDNITVIVAWL